MKRPTIFLSSTIYDFRDLRSALKYYLENQGCTVLASEFNDFQKPLDEHSYDACLRAIGQSDYFILMIGARVGGLYDSQNRISITQKEYRTAYELHLEDKLHLLTFVRSEVWQVREDRKALKRHLEKQHMSDTEADEILNYPSKFSNDAALISSFIEEVGRNAETKSAVAGKSSRPTGNWIHVFKDFGDILAAIEPLLLSGLPVEEASFRRALEAELIQVLRICLMKLQGETVYAPILIVDRIIRKYPIPYENTIDTSVTFPTKDWKLFTALLIHTMGKRFETVVLRDALSASTFLKFDVSEGAFQGTPVSRALNALFREINLFNEANCKEFRSVLWENSPARRPRNLGDAEIRSTRLLPLYHLCHRWANITLLSEAIVGYLQIGKFEEPRLFAPSPVEEMNVDLEKENVTEEEVQKYLEARRDGIY